MNTQTQPKIATSLAVLCALLSVLSFGVAPAMAAECSSCKPWWHLASSARPRNLPPEGTGEIALAAENFGDGGVQGGLSAVRIVDTLPAGLKAVGISGGEPNGNQFTPMHCALATLSCTFEGELPPYDLLEVRIKVEVLPGAESGEANSAVISGGGAPSISTESAITVSEAATPFGLEGYELGIEEEGGAVDTQAGSHPFQVTGTVALNQEADTNSLAVKPEVEPAGLAKDIFAKLPPGLIGNPTPLPRCSLGKFLTNLHAEANQCPAEAAIGVASVTLDEPQILGQLTLTVPIFNLEPYSGEPARFGFFIPIAGVPVLLDASVRSGEGYAIAVGSSNISQIAALTNVRTTFWGTPADPRHDASRGWSCLAASNHQLLLEGVVPCEAGNGGSPPAFLTVPTSCAAPLASFAEADSWAQPSDVHEIATSRPLPTLDGCNRLGFNPSVEARPTTNSASAASGLDVNVDFKDEGLLGEEGVAESQLKDTSVVLPEGFTIDPSAGVGLAGCTPAGYARETLGSAPGTGCPNEAKLGTVEIETPLLTQRIDGNIFIAQPYENPFGSLVGLYIVAKNPETGVLIKLAGKVTPNPVTGQLTTTFENTPQLPFDHFNFHFREGAQAPLITPATCGTYTTQALLAPWSEPLQALTDTSSFTITSGSGGGACPSGGAPPFTPQIAAGTINNNAGAFSPVYVHLTRTDGEQEIAGFSTNLPAGLTGDLSGIPFCPEAAIEAARHKSGAQEEAAPSCPAASQIGHTLVGTGVGAVLAYVPGEIYLAGPFKGAPFSIVSVTSAKVGPFDLGTVVLRFGLNIDPYTAKVSVSPSSSEPIPTIIDGIVTHVRDIRVYIDKQNFTLNPTSCEPMRLSSTLTSNLGAASTTSSPFQSVNCANLKFAPKFAVSTSGKTSKANGAGLAVKLTYPQGPAGIYANIARVKVDLPKQLPSRLTTLQKACTSKQFEANPAGCPAPSVIGHAKAITPILPVPLEGPAYFVSHGGEAFPSLIMVLQGYGVTIDLVGSTFISKAGITSSTFKAVPDQPVTSFELTLPQGKFSALAANGNLCKTKLAMPTEFLAQNGAKINQSTKISVTGCPKVKKAKRRKHKKQGRPGASQKKR